MPMLSFALFSLVPPPGLIDVFIETGFAGPALLVLGAVAATKAVRRWLALRPMSLAPEGLQRGLEHAIRSKQPEQAVALAAASPSPLGRFVAAGMLLRPAGLDEMLANCERAAMKEALLRQAGAVGLARFGTVILMFAIFGTVLGLMSSLQVLGILKEPTVQDAVTGIRESLGCTAIGLFLSLACFGAWAMLSSRAVTALHEVREIAEELLAEAARPDRAG
jgi:biopolymer transport protein ExbB/TolQ